MTHSAKAGARHSNTDQQHLDAAVTHLVEAGANVPDEGNKDPATAEDNGGIVGLIPNTLKAISKTDTELRVGNYIVIFGGRDLTAFADGLGNGTYPVKPNPDGSLGERFSKSVVVDSRYTQTGRLSEDWEHGIDPDSGYDPASGKTIKAPGLGDVLGYVDWSTVKRDEKGIFVQRVLDRRKKYMQWIEPLIEAGLVGTSSKAIAEFIKVTPSGEITQWPLESDTLTVTPFETRMMTDNVVQAMKALGIAHKAVQPAPDGAQAKPTPQKPAKGQAPQKPTRPATNPVDPNTDPNAPSATAQMPEAAAAEGTGVFMAFELGGQFFVYDTDSAGEAVADPVAGPYGTAAEAMQAAQAQETTEPPAQSPNAPTAPPLKQNNKPAQPGKGIPNMEENEDIKSLTNLVKEQSEQIKALKAIVEAPRLGTPAGGNSEQATVAPPEKPFKSMAEQCFAVRDFTIGNATEMQINKMIAAKALATGQKATGANELISSEGGAVVQTDFATDIFQRVYQNGAVISRTAKQVISNASNGIRIPAIDEQSRVDGSRFGGIQAYWGYEAGTITKSKPLWRTVSLELKKLYALVYGTNELLADAPAFDSYLGRVLPQEMTFKIEDGIINGLGGGLPLGIISAPCTVSVAKEPGQASATIVFNNIAKMWARMWAGGASAPVAQGTGGSMSGAVWLVNQDTLPQLYTLQLPVGTGGQAVFVPAGGLSGLPYSTLFNRPIIPVEQCATLGTVGDIILADLSQYAVAEKGGIQAAQSIHIQFLTDETAFRWTYRVDGVPLWNTALTPYKGTNSQSPFITLATR